MRRARLKPRGQVAVYHCISRTTGGQRLFGPQEKEKFRLLMRRQAAFSQVQVVTDTILGTHFHIVVRVPAEVQLTDEELLATLKKFYGPKSAQAEAFGSALKKEKECLPTLRDQYGKRMGDVSAFMKELKQAFSRWFNKQHDRFGTLWAERFTSVLVQDRSMALLVIAAYVDLNAVRAGITPDPKDYRFCGYAEAVARAGPARSGLLSLFPPKAPWKKVLAGYRKFLYVEAARAGHSKKKVLDRETILKVFEEGGELSVPELLRLRIRYFTAGVVLGTREYVDKIYAKHLKKHTPKRKKGARKMKGKYWGDLVTMRDLQKEVIG